MEKNYLNFKKINEKETELYIYGPIEERSLIDKWFKTGKDKTGAFTLKDALASVDTPNLTVRINSYGGLVSEGLAIYSLLSTFKGHLKTVVDGFACSAASIIFMAGQERIVPDSGLLMIHNASMSASGDSNVMQKVSEDLKKITQPSIDIYKNKTNLEEEQIKEMMDKETWITSEEAFEWGFSTSKERENQYMQALEADFVYKLVIKNKELQKKLEETEENNNINQKKEEISLIVKETINEIKNDLEKEKLDLEKNNLNYNNMIKEDAWASFFNKKN